ncbi:MAG: IS3 family transposase, partial [Cytophagaceae bacterium]
MSTTRTNAEHHVEIITSVQRRRRFSASQKMSIVNEIREVGASVSSIARRHG